MGILSGKDLLSSKYITAEISDSSDRIHYVPIKHTIGDYFIADLDGQLFVFTLKGARVLVHRKTATKTFNVIQYDTSHYGSIKPDTKALELMLKKNSLGKMDRMMHNILRVLGRRESSEEKEFEPHNIKDLVEEFANTKGEYQEEVKQIKAYLDEMDVDKIVTPVRKITDFITDDLIATHPSFLGGMLQQYHRVQGELRIITNRPEKPTGSYMKFIMVALLIGMGGAGAYIAYDSGAFDGITGFTDNLGTIQEGFKGLPAPGQIQRTNTGGTDYSDAALQSKYPDCNALKADINAGVLDFNKMSTTMQGFIEDCPAP